MANINQSTLLDQIAIAAPCTADWNAMQGDDRTRYCQSCCKHVYDISSLSRTAAEALIAEKEGNICGRLFRRADGTVVVDNCPVGLRSLRDRLKRTQAALAAFLGAMFFGAAWAQPAQNAPQMELGKIAIPVKPDPAPKGPAGTGSQTQLRMTVQVDDIAAAESGMYLDVDKAMRGMMVSKNFKVERAPKRGDRTDKSADEEAFRQWYATMSNELFECWKLAPAATGQMTATMWVTPEHGLTIQEQGAYFADTEKAAPSALYTAASEQFSTAIESAVSMYNRRQQQASLAVKHPIAKVAFQVTFGYDPNRFPRHDAQGFGLFARLDNEGVVQVTPSGGDSLLRHVNAHNHSINITANGNLTIGPGASITVESDK